MDEKNESDGNLKQSGFWTLPYIHIFEDNWTEGKVEWIQDKEETGDYNIIENVTIDMTDFTTCIIIEDSSESFIIRNCTLINAAGDAGIFLDDADNGWIYNNTFYNNYFGVKSWHSSYNHIYDNMIYDSESYGIYISGGTSNRIYNNHINNNSYGIWGAAPVNSFIEDNFIYNNSATGIYLHIHSSANTIRDNFVHNNDDYGILLHDGCNYNTIDNNTIWNHMNGIYINESSNNNIIDANTIYNTTHSQIFLKNSNSAQIKNNHIFNTNFDTFGYGIHLQDNSHYNVIDNNNIYDNKWNGIVLINNCDLNEIYDNFFNNNLHDGIQLGQYCNNNTIDNNRVYEGGTGISLFTTCYTNFITRNTFEDLSGFGAYIPTGCDYNYIYDNNFRNNGFYHAYDNGTGNMWFWENLGNYWDDYTGHDKDDDGIGNIWYDNIDGEAGSLDKYPKWSDGNDTPYLYIHYPEENLIFGDWGPYYDIDTNIADKDQIWFVLNQTGYPGAHHTILNVTNWEGNIDYEIWEDFENGTVTLTFWINDTAGNLGFDRITVKKDIIPPDITINFPDQYSRFEVDNPYYSIVIEEPHLDTVWFTIDQNETMHEFPDISEITSEGIDGRFNRTLWDSLPNRTIKITIWANDTVGNLGFTELFIQKGPTIAEGITAIPLGSSFIVFTLIGIISIIWIMRKKIK